MTALSVLAALVFWGSIWGLQGAVLSVPLLAAMKIALEEADYPLAKMILRMVRESASIDDAVEAGKSRKVRKMQRRHTQMAIKTNTPLKSPRTPGGSAEGNFRNPLAGVDDEADLEAGGDTE